MDLGDLPRTVAAMALSAALSITGVYSGLLLTVNGYHWIIAWSPSVISILVVAIPLSFLNKERWRRFFESFSSGCSSEVQEKAKKWIIADFTKRREDSA